MENHPSGSLSRFALLFIAALSLLIMAPLHASAADQPLKLRFSTRWPVSIPWFKDVYIAALEDIKKNSQGRLDYELYDNSTLAKPTEVYDAVRTGKAHLAEFTPAYTPGRFPLTDVYSLPITFPTAKVTVETSMGLFDKILSQEYGDTHTFMVWRADNFFYVGNKEINKLEDLKGLKIRTSGGLIAKTVKKLGATPITMGISEVYMSLNTGVIDGAVLGPAAIAAFRLHEVAKYCLQFSFGGIMDGIPMHKPTWDKLPADLKTVVANSMRGVPIKMAQVYDSSLSKHLGLITEKGGKVYQLKPEEFQRWTTLLKPVADEWIAEMKENGKPGDKAVAIYREECQKQGLAFPF